MANKIYNVNDIANYFIYLASNTRIGDDEKEVEGITNLKLQKVLYFAQAYFLAKKHKSLFKDDIEAWEYGPVIPSVYHKYKKYGSQPIIKVSIVDKISDTDKKMLDEIWEVFGGYSASRLVDMTHAHSPWKEARDRSNNIITKKSMEEYYSDLLNK